MIFTVLLYLGKCSSVLTTLGVKAILALNSYIRSVLRKGDVDDISKMLETISVLPHEEMKQIIVIDDPEDEKSVLHHSLRHHSNNIVTVSYTHLTLPTKA